MATMLIAQKSRATEKIGMPSTAMSYGPVPASINMPTICRGKTRKTVMKSTPLRKAVRRAIRTAERTRSGRPAPKL